MNVDTPNRLLLKSTPNMSTVGPYTPPPPPPQQPNDKKAGDEDEYEKYAQQNNDLGLTGFWGPHESARSFFDETGSVIQKFENMLPFALGGPETFVGKGEVGRMMGAIASLESGGNRTGAIRYNAVGPLCRGHVTGRFSSEVDGRALGGWQVMAENVGPWAREAGLGNVTPEQFLRDKEIQRKVVEFQINKLAVERHLSVADVAAVWQSGRTLEAAARNGAHDQNITTQKYASMVMHHYEKLGDGSTQVAQSKPDRKSLSVQQASADDQPVPKDGKKSDQQVAQAAVSHVSPPAA